MKIIVSKEMLKNENNVREKILKFIKDKELPSNWAVNVINGKYVFEYIDSNNVNLFGEINDDYLEMII